MIGLRRNKRGDMVLTIDTYIDIDSTPDIQSDYFDCIYINTTSERAFHAILFGASPILSYKCSYKPLFVNTAVSGKEQITDYIVDAYVSDMSNEKVYEIIDRIKMAKRSTASSRKLQDLHSRTSSLPTFCDISYHATRESWDTDFWRNHRWDTSTLF